MRRTAAHPGRLLAIGLLCLAGALACARDRGPARAGATAAAQPPDRLESKLAPAEGSGEADRPAETGKSAPNPGKVERLQKQSRISRYEAATGGGEGTDGDGAGKQSELIRLEADSYGTPGLVLVRAMDGAQALGYTILELDEHDLYFIALKNPSLVSSVLGSAGGVCKIAVGTEASADGTMTKVALKGRAGTATARPSCVKDLERILRYARGEVRERPKKRERRPWLKNVEP